MDQFYVEDGYVDSAYFEVIVDSGVIGLQPYFAEDYAETGYAEQRGSEFTLYANTDVIIVTGSAIVASAGSLTVTAGFAGTVEANIVVAASTSAAASRSRASGATIAGTALTAVTGAKTVGFDAAFAAVSSLSATPYRIIEAGADFSGVMSATMTAIAFKNHTAALDSHATMSVDADITTDAGGLLEYFADLNAQAARFRSTDSNMVVTTHTSGNTAVPGSEIGASATLDGASIFTTTASLTASVDNILYGDADLTSTVTQTANAIEYIRKSDLPPVAGQRPWQLSAFNESNPFTTPKFGSKSYSITRSTLGASFENYARYLVKRDELAPTFGANEQLHIEFWYYYTGTTADNVVTLYKDPATYVLNDDTVFRIKNLGNQLVFEFPTDFENDSQVTSTLTAYTWSHFVIKAEGNTVKLWKNGSLVNTNTWDTSFYNFNSFTEDLFLSFGNDPNIFRTSADAFASLDEFRILLGNSATVESDSGVAFTDTNYTVPTSAPYNTSTTKILLHFDDNYVDSLYGIQDTSASVNAITSISSTITGSTNLAAELSAVADVTANAGTIKVTEAALQANGFQVTVNNKIGGLFADATVTSSVAAQASRYRLTDSVINNTVAVNAQVAKTTDVTVTITDAFVPNIEANTNVTGVADFAVNTTMSATSAKTTDVNSGLLVQASIVTAATTSVDSNAALSVSIGITAVARTIAVDQYVYIIPKETRFYTVSSETRSYSVIPETRTYTIEGT